MNDRLVSTSKFMSLILRHKPETIGLTLDAHGWADIDELLRLANAAGKSLDRSVIEQVVADNDKQRFIISDDRGRIRANQGHSIAVDLALTPREPPAVLFHGTATRFLDAIRERGLLHGNRQHVHLSLDEVTAVNVGQRHGKPVIVEVAAKRMHEAGHVFFRSENGVWLTEHVPVAYIAFPAK